MSDALRMPDPVSAPKRVILRYLTGPFAGIDRIIGLTDDQPLQTVLENVVLLTLSAPAGLLKVGPRHVLYKEIAPPAYTFSPEQV